MIPETAITILENLRIQQSSQRVIDALTAALEALELQKREQEDGK